MPQSNKLLTESNGTMESDEEGGKKGLPTGQHNDESRTNKNASEASPGTRNNETTPENLSKLIQLPRRGLEPINRTRKNINFKIKQKGNSGEKNKGGNLNRLIVTAFNIVFSPGLMHKILLALAFIPFCNSQSIVGYDTAGRYSDKNIVMKTISLLGVEDCSNVQTQSYLPPEDKPIQIIYTPTETSLSMLQCNIKVTTKIFHCASNAFRSDVYPEDVLNENQVTLISGEQCRKIHREKTFDLEVYDHIIRLKAFSHSEQTIQKTMVGVKKANGGCIGGEIEIENVKKSNIVVITTVSYLIKQMGGIFSPTKKSIAVGDLVTLSAKGLPETSCDNHYGCFYPLDPDSIPRNDCERTEQFMKGDARIFRPNTTPDIATQGYLDIVQITSDTDKSIGTTLTLNEEQIICGTLVRRTNVPRLYVNMFKEPGRRLVSHRLFNHTATTQDRYRLLDILTSSSNIYLRGTLSISEQFDKVSYRLCELRRAALLAILRDLLTSGPAPLLNYREGILFKRVGSVAYIFLGVPVQARLRPTQACFNEIPVTLLTQNTEVPAFLTSKGRIIVSNGTRILCGDRPAMHFIREESAEVARFNKSLDLFPDLAFNSEIDNAQTNGFWLCQFPGKFVACEPPSSLSPLIGVRDHWIGIKGQFLQQSIFGAEGREILYVSQTEGYNREVVWTQITNPNQDGIGSGVGELLISNLSQGAQRRIREIILPTFFFLFGDLSVYVGQIMITLIILSGIFKLICLCGRLVMMYRSKGISRHLLLALFEGVYNAVIPWRAAAEQRKQAIQEVTCKVNQQGIDIRNLIALMPQQAPQSPSTGPGRFRCLHYPQIDRELKEMPKLDIHTPTAPDSKGDNPT